MPSSNEGQDNDSYQHAQDNTTRGKIHLGSLVSHKIRSKNATKIIGLEGFVFEQLPSGPAASERIYDRIEAWV